MRFSVVKLEDFIGSKARIYSVFLHAEGQTLFERFIDENIGKFNSEISDIISRIRTINSNTGARVQFFKMEEGYPGDGVCREFRI